MHGRRVLWSEAGLGLIAACLLACGPVDRAQSAAAREGSPAAVPLVDSDSPSATADALAKRLVGDWLRTSQQSLFARGDALGLRIEAGGRWALLLGPDLEPGQAGVEPGEHGHWELVDTSLYNGPGSFQLNLETKQDTVTFVYPVLAEDDTRLRLLSSGYDTEYVRADDSASDDPDDKQPEPEEVLLDGVPVEAIAGDAQQRANPAWCDAVEPDIAHFASEKDFTAALLGVWTQCGTETAFCSSDQAGIEIAEQGRWYKLYADADGRLWRGRGWDRRGTWTIIDTSDFNGPGSYQLNLEIDGSGTVISHPVITRDGFTMRIDNNGVCRGHYVKSRPADSSPDPGKSIDGVPVEAIAGDAQQRASADLCVTPEADVARFASEAGFVEGLLGVWTLCGEQSAFCSTEESGLELTADGRWYKLFADADGRLWRGRGWDRRGSWTIIDTSDFNGPGSYQLNLAIDGSGTVISHPVIASDGRAMRIDNNGVCTGHYVRPGPTGL